MKIQGKNGISLIVLVITIIVIIILAAAVILSINNNNPIENARKARIVNDIASSKEAYLLAYGEEVTEKKGNVNNIDYNKIKENVGELPEDIVVTNDGIVYTGNDNIDIDVIKKSVEEIEIIKIIEENFKFRDGYITNIPAGYSVSDVKQVFGDKVKIYNNKGVELTVDSNGFTTGCTLRTKDGEKIVGTAVYFGDTNTDGYINMVDANFILASINNNFSECTKAQRYAMDINADGVINNVDVDLIRGRYSVGKPEQNRYVSNIKF